MSDEARPWEKERLTNADLEDVPWDAEVDCPFCRTGGHYRISEPEDLLALLMVLRG